MEQHRGRVTRRRALGLLGLAGAGAGGLAALLRGRSAPAPRPAPGTQRVDEAYGPGTRQRGQWWVPPGGADGGPLPTVVLVHGGYWRPGFDLSLQDAVAADLSGRGFLCWNVDYAASDAPWPATLVDVAAGYDRLARGRFAAQVDPGRVAVVGHSAGGHLALWLAARPRLSTEALRRAGAPPGLAAQPHVPRPAVVVAQAPVAGLADASRQRLGGGAVDALVGGGPDARPERYAVADPQQLLPTGVPSVLVHGERDRTVPVGQSEGYVEQARRLGDDSRLVRVPGGHFEHLDPRSAACAALREALELLRA